MRTRGSVESIMSGTRHFDQPFEKGLMSTNCRGRDPAGRRRAPGPARTCARPLPPPRTCLRRSALELREPNVRPLADLDGPIRPTTSGDSRDMGADIRRDPARKRRAPPRQGVRCGAVSFRNIRRRDSPSPRERIPDGGDEGLGGSLLESSLGRPAFGTTAVFVRARRRACNGVAHHPGPVAQPPT